MKKKLTFLAAAFFCGVLFTSFSPSLDGRAVVADDGVLPKGIFAKTVGYLPGDSISVTNLLNKSTVEILVIGAIDPSEGVAILLSPEAARLLGLEKGADSVVKITKRSGQLDEAVAGTAVISGNAVQEAEQNDADMPKEAESEEENADESDSAEDATEKSDSSEVKTQDTPAAAPTEDKAELSAKAENTETPTVPEPDAKPVEKAEREPLLAERVPESTNNEIPENAPQKKETRAEPEKVYADSLAENETSTAKQEKTTDNGVLPYEVIADDRLPDAGGAGAYPEPAVEKISSPYSNLERVDEGLPPEPLPDAKKQMRSDTGARKPLASAEKVQDDLTTTPVYENTEHKKASAAAEETRRDEHSKRNAREPVDANDDVIASPFKEEATERSMQECFEPETLPDEIADAPFNEDGALSVFETSAEESAAMTPEKKPVQKYSSNGEKSSGADDSITLVPTGMNPPPSRSKKAGAEAKPKTPSASPRPVEKTPAPAPATEHSDDPAITDLVTDDTIKPEPVAAPARGDALAKNTVSSLKELERGKYYVQIGVFKEDGNIKPIFDKYQNEYPITIVPLSSGTAKQVLIGPLSVDEYGTVLNRFKSYGFKDAFLRKIR